METKTSKRLSVLKKSLEKKQEAFNNKVREHFDVVKMTNGQPLNDKKNGRKTLNKWDKQNQSIEALERSIEKTKEAIIKEEWRINKVNKVNEELPKPILEYLAQGKIVQWRKFPNYFFVPNVDKARIIWLTKKNTLAHKYYRSITDEKQRELFKNTYNKLRSEIEEMKTEQKPINAPSKTEPKAEKEPSKTKPKTKPKTEKKPRKAPTKTTQKPRKSQAATQKEIQEFLNIFFKTSDEVKTEKKPHKTPSKSQAKTVNTKVDKNFVAQFTEEIRIIKRFVNCIERTRAKSTILNIYRDLQKQIANKTIRKTSENAGLIRELAKRLQTALESTDSKELKQLKIRETDENKAFFDKLKKIAKTNVRCKAVLLYNRYIRIFGEENVSKTKAKRLATSIDNAISNGEITDKNHFYKPLKEALKNIRDYLNDRTDTIKMQSATLQGLFGCECEKKKLSEVNNEFNSSLNNYINNKHKGNIFELGYPNKLLQKIGLDGDLPIQLIKRTLTKKIKKHGFNAKLLQDLPTKIANPIMVFNSNKADKTEFGISKIIIIEGIIKKEGILSVVISKYKNKQNALLINKINSIHGKSLKNIWFYIEDDLLEYYNKEKVMNILPVVPIDPDSNIHNFKTNLQKYFGLPTKIEKQNKNSLKGTKQKTEPETSPSALIADSTNDEQVLPVKNSIKEYETKLLNYFKAPKKTTKKGRKGKKNLNGTEQKTEQSTDQNRINVEFVKPTVKQTVIPSNAPSNKPTKTEQKPKIKDEIFTNISLLDQQSDNKIMQLQGDLGRFLGYVEQYEYSILLRGDKGAGKSRLLFQMMNLFAQHNFKVACFSLEIGKRSNILKSMRDEYIQPQNVRNVSIADECPNGIKTIEEAAKNFDVVCIDSWGKIGADIKQEAFNDLRKKYPETMFIIIFQSTTNKTARGGSMPEYDAGMVIQVNNGGIAVCEKNRYSGEDLQYSVFKQKLIEN